MGSAADWSAIQIGTGNNALNTATIVCYGISNLVAPDLTVTKDALTGGALLSWTAVPGADKYEIWCALDDGSFIHIIDVTGTEFCDTAYAVGTMHFYIVRAVRGTTTGEWSNIVVLFEMRRPVGVPPRP